jgi:phosphotransferase system HPr-like phosphotransfer protein
MKSVTILLDTIEKVRRFVNQISTYEGDFDIISDRYIIDAKSIMGIFSLDLSKPLKLQIHSEGVVAKVIEEFKEFIVE